MTGWVVPLAGAAAILLVAPLPSAHAADMRSRQWYLDAMRADDLWKVSVGAGVTVAVVDTGVDASVPELRGRVLRGKNVENSDGGTLSDEQGHGTSMAATIAGSGAQGGIKGLAPSAKILPVKVSSQSESFGGLGIVAKGIRYAADSDAKVINVSQSGFPTSGERADLQAAINYASKKGKLVFAGSGNDGDGSPEYPAAMPGAVAVGAVASSGKVSKFSNFGSHLALAAPGEKIPSYCPKNEGYCESKGTSQATALASASAALIWSKHPNWTANQVLRVMMETAGHDGPVPSKYIGYGTIRPAQVLLEGMGEPGDPDVNPLLAARQNESPTPSTSPSPANKNKGDSKDDQKQPRSENAAAESDGGGTLWIVVTIVAAAAVAAGALVAVRVRNRRAP
ncbi:type VII secretion-associated serine protease mycosin [Streptomyces monticola]|uniref:Type VII secretion-associated serine protease mycosin n=1 Tax=Streptomyces monticola TaxID=2666263 RepID=A0ABW2JHU6_9ACTN